MKLVQAVAGKNRDCSMDKASHAYLTALVTLAAASALKLHDVSAPQGFEIAGDFSAQGPLYCDCCSLLHNTAKRWQLGCSLIKLHDHASFSEQLGALA